MFFFERFHSPVLFSAQGKAETHQLGLIFGLIGLPDEDRMVKTTLCQGKPNMELEL